MEDIIKNPYLHLGSEKPSGDILVSYDGGKTFDDSVEWLETRTCMMAGSAGGHGYFKEGWATSQNSGTDVGLICDPPDFWINLDEEEKYYEFENKKLKEDGQK